MKLRNGKPLWLATRPQSLRIRRLTSSVTCDVAVIGAGITGTLVAHQLLAAGLNVVMLDKREAGYGSTAASTGLLLYQPDTSIEELSRLHGRRTARRVYQLGRKAIQDLGVMARVLRIPCGWRARRTLYVASRSNDRPFLRGEGRRTRSLGFPSELLSAAELRRKYALRFPAALGAPGAAEVHALALNRGVLRHCLRNPGFRLFQRTRVRSVQEKSDGIRLRTDGGGEVNARHVVVATGYESRPFMTSPLVRTRTTYVIASQPVVPERLEHVRCLMWETARPYFYLRTTIDNRIVFGGLDDPYAPASQRARKLAPKTRQLERQFAALFPDLAFKADYAWSGVFAETKDGLPCIGPLKQGSRVLYALGYGGNGITYSQIAAKILRDACLGRKNPDARLFAFDRTHRRT